MISFFIFSKQMNDEMPLYLSKEQEQYIEIGYQIIDVDHLNDKYKFEWIKARNSARKKTLGPMMLRKYFDNFKAGYSLICPDYHNDTHLVL